MKKTIKLTLMILLFVTSFTQTLPLTTKSEAARKAYIEARTFTERNSFQNPANFKVAYNKYDKAVKLDKNFLMAKMFRTFFYRDDFKKRRAILQDIYNTYETAHISKGEKMFIKRNLGNIFGAFKTPAEQQELTQKLIEMYPNDPRILQFDAFNKQANGDLDGAIKVFEKVIQLDPNFIPTYNSLGYAYKNKGDYKKAENAFKTQMEKNPENPNVYDSYAELLLKLGRYEESIKSYEGALKTDPLFPSAVMGIASNLMHLGHYEEARTKLNNLMEIAPDDQIRGGICWAIAMTYIDEGNLDNAINELNKNYQYSKKQTNNEFGISGDLLRIGNIYLELGDVAKAESFYKKSQEVIQNSNNQAINQQTKEDQKMFSLYSEALVAAERGNLENAKKLSAKLRDWAEKTKRNGTVRQAHDLAGIIALKEKQYEIAIQEFNKGNRGDAYTMYRIATAHKELGNEEEARKMYKYVAEYRGNLNMNHALVRRKAEKMLAHL